jgi:hypothetical protein
LTKTTRVPCTAVGYTRGCQRLIIELHLTVYCYSIQMARLVSYPLSFLAALLLILLGSASAYTSCVGLCGFVNPNGQPSNGDRGITGCYCDTYCHLHKDCCPDEVSVCESALRFLLQS